MQAATKRAKWRYFHIRPRDTNESVCMVYRHTVWINRCYNVIIGTRWSLEMWIDKNCAICVCVHVFDCVITDQEEGSWAAAKMLWCGGGDGGGGGVEKSHHFMLNKTAFLCEWWVCVVCRHRENTTQHIDRTQKSNAQMPIEQKISMLWPGKCTTNPKITSIARKRVSYLLLPC